MVTLIGKHLASMVVITIALVAVLFYLQHISPLDPVHAALGGQASASAVAQEKHALGLDAPVLTQFKRYLVDLLHGDLGTSYRTRRAVSTDIAAYFPRRLSWHLPVCSSRSCSARRSRLRPRCAGAAQECCAW